MTVATVRVFILLVLQVAVSNSSVMLSNFEHMSHFDDKQGIDCIIMNKRVVTLCECGTLCGLEINACKSFFYTKDEGLCSLYNEDLFQLTLVNVPGSKGYSLARTYLNHNNSVLLLLIQRIFGI